jgi:hypothetical protein
MVQAALKEEMTVPSGGIADFYLNDDEFEAFEREEAKKEFGDSGLAQFEPLAKKMASYGRFGDDVVIHAERGELVVPKALIEDNPQLKDSIFSHLRELGVEDPERYVVGSSANSLNPTTGMPEFFLKKLFRGVKKAFKSVGKVLKKVAPIVLPFVLGPAGLGLSSVYAGAVGAGLGTLIQGGSVKDAFKSALLGGATGAVFSGFSGSGSFGENVSNALSNPVQGGYLGSLQAPASGPALSAAPSELAQTQLDAARNSASTFAPSDVTQTQLDAVTSSASQPLTAAERLDAFGVKPLRTSLSPSPEVPYKVADLTESAKNMITGGGEGRFAAAKDVFMPAGPTQSDIITRAGQLQQQAAAQNLTLTGADAMAAATKELTPGLLRAYGPAAALGTAGAAAAGFFSAPEEEPEEERLGVEEYYEQDEDRYGLSTFNPKNRSIPGFNFSAPRLAQGPFVTVSPYEDGGQVFPRRNGGIMPNEGIPNQDSVRAMLMPGEFVMTTDAVRGLGGGNLNNGINNMYDMMRNLESRGRAFA